MLSVRSFARWTWFAASLFLLLHCATAQVPAADNRTDADSLRQGRWTVMLDQDQVPTTDSGSTYYYRITDYVDGRPVGPVVDYFPDGRMRTRTDSLISERPERPHGRRLIYSAEGRTVGAQYFVDGVLDPAATIAHEERLRDSIRAEVGTNHVDYVDVLDNLANRYQDYGQLDTALARFEEARAIKPEVVGRETRSYLFSLLYVAGLYRDLGYFARAEETYLEAMQLAEDVWGKRSPYYGGSANNLAILYNNMKRYEDAEPLLRFGLEVARQNHGERHRFTLGAMTNLASVYRRMGAYEQAEALILRVREIYEELYGRESAYYAYALLEHSAIHINSRSRYKEKIALSREACQTLSRTLGEQHRITVRSLNDLGSAYYLNNALPKADTFYRRAMEQNLERYGPEHREYATSLNNLANVRRAMGDYDGAEALDTVALAIRRRTYGDEGYDTYKVLHELSINYRAEGRHAEAEENLLRVIDAVTAEVRRVFPALSEREKEAFYWVRAPFFEHFGSFVADRGGERPPLRARLYDQQLATKALVLNASAKWK
ncbi:MAG: tetratricopeptide repeat protein, partial [Catalinimonas sp.]